MNFEGTITYISEEQAVGQNNIPKITFVLEENTDREIKGSVVVDILWEKIELIKSHKIWDIIKVSLNFKASEYNGKRYNRVSCRKIEWQGSSSNGSSQSKSSNDDDLPF